RRPDQRQQGGTEHHQAERTAYDKAAMAQRAAPESVREQRTHGGGHNLGRNAQRGAHRLWTLMRGSMKAYSTSTTKLTMTTTAASSITQLRTTIRSRLAIDWKITRPTPGRKNTFSITIVPASRLGNCSPITVMTGIIALRSTCRHNTSRLLKPLARAVRTKSSRSPPSTAERVTRARIAACTTDSEIAGNSSDLIPAMMLSSQPANPPAESHCSFTENSRISRMANQKLGSAMPNCVSDITPTSPSLL